MELKKIVDPIQLFKKWLSEAEKKEIRDPNAMQLATVSKDGLPSVRIVLLKDIIDGDFVFYTNYESRKSKEIIQTGKGALCFYWKSLNRQVRLVGNLEKVSNEVYVWLAEDFGISNTIKFQRSVHSCFVIGIWNLKSHKRFK